MKSFYKVWLGIALFAIGIGIVILVITFSAGVSWADFNFSRMSIISDKVPTHTIQESYTGVENIDFNIQYGNVEIVKGNVFSIDAKRYLEDDLKSYVSNGTWYIEEENNDKSYHIFGFNIPAKHFFEWDEMAPQITITIPENFNAGDYSVVIGAGKLNADEIIAKKSYLKVAAGSISIDKLDVDGSSEYSVDAGQLKIKEAKVNDIAVDCSVGQVVIEGTVTGDNDITCDVGSVKLNLDGKEENYSYDVSSDLGSVEIDHRKYQGISNEEIGHNGADNDLSLSCNVGSITVDFN